ncbi:hypothetical protein [Spongiibacter marinus]|uniref:hypothetical protein n=1 Tax=Spongiibacter marinus TaxID=354246 RepID=UPI00196A02B0|nr:hypothetical protein [Spongiibacter marinus]
MNYREVLGSWRKIGDNCPEIQLVFLEHHVHVLTYGFHTPSKQSAGFAFGDQLLL